MAVDFTEPDAALGNAPGVPGRGRARGDRDDRVRSRPLQGATGANVFIAPNFAIGAVLMMRFAAEAARHMERAEIVELHHDRKLDAPSGTAGAHRRADGGAGGARCRSTPCACPGWSPTRR